ncbi:hypothetical protein F2Q69_00012746 [Brassica cretica]|uniref:Uncharacterized protein n=1 Tax=Brassica cretica TaxID=69181 RepID=A0A8S9QTA0_BRACR|nr:hypothetical protein F2Q69_00012746 [Brassica cretica]
MTSDMSNTHYHGEEISADTYATLTKHQFNLESLGERLQRMENTTATLKDKWHRGDEAMRDFTALNLTQLLVLGRGMHGIGFFKQVWKDIGQKEVNMTWWQPPSRLDSWKPVQSWSMILHISKL